MNPAVAKQSELDQRWAAARDWIWDRDAVELAQLDALLVRESSSRLLQTLIDNPDVLRAVRRLAALALDEALVRGVPSDDGDTGQEGSDV